MRYIETRFEVRAGDVTLVTDLLAALLADAGKIHYRTKMLLYNREILLILSQFLGVVVVLWKNG